MNNTDKQPPMPVLYLIVKPDKKEEDDIEEFGDIEGFNSLHFLRESKSNKPKDENTLASNVKGDPRWRKRCKGLNLITHKCNNMDCDASQDGKEV